MDLAMVLRAIAKATTLQTLLSNGFMEGCAPSSNTLGPLLSSPSTAKHSSMT
ncbi:unnamed protein product [Dovyalis caffra]|uniref:Uncharacterized protein n=1 Tax=Dovyalis caffra TaxID=77055 RepID=A0AAV1SIC8_9ROSI|nr:unnamed protein product [Dovyalis caffra]